MSILLVGNLVPYSIQFDSSQTPPSPITTSYILWVKNAGTSLVGKPCTSPIQCLFANPMLVTVGGTAAHTVYLGAPLKPGELRRISGIRQGQLPPKCNYVPISIDVDKKVGQYPAGPAVFGDDSASLQVQYVDSTPCTSPFP